MAYSTTTTFGRQMTSHKFKVGQRVSLIQSQGRSRDTFEIVRVLPLDQGAHHCRIKSIADGHERAVGEGELIGSLSAPG
jgi:hypothetical protein